MAGSEIEDGPIIFHLRLTNLSGDPIDGATHGFRVYSPSDAAWGATTMGKVYDLHEDPYYMSNFARVLNVDGVGEDTVAIFASIYWMDGGIPPGFDEVTHTITVGPIDPAYEGGQICLDSCWFRPANEWLWSLDMWNGYPARPTWDGPHCFTIANCCRIMGDVNQDGNPIIDIDDLIYLVSYMFQEGPEPACMDATDIDGNGTATPDIADLVYMVTFMFQGGPPPAECP